MHSCMASIALWLQWQDSRAVRESVETPAKRPSHIHMSSIQHQSHWGFWHLFSDNGFFSLFFEKSRLEKAVNEKRWGGSRECVISRRGKWVTREANRGGSAQVVQSSWPWWAPSSSQSKQAGYISICVTHAPIKSQQAFFFFFFWKCWFESGAAADVLLNRVGGRGLLSQPACVLCGTQGCQSRCVCVFGLNFVELV